MPDRITQVSTSVSGTPDAQERFISQVYMSVSRRFDPGALDVTQNATFQNVNTFPAGGTIVMDVTQNATFQNVNTFPVGGLVGAISPMGPISQITGGRSIRPPVVLEPNRADRELENEADEARLMVTSWTGANSGPGFGSGIRGLGGLIGLGVPKGFGDLGPNESLAYNQRRFDNAAPERLARFFAKRGRVTTPAVLAGDTVVVDFVVPTGYWCRIQQVAFVYTGTGFVDGSGDLEWRLKIGSKYARNYGRVLFELGSPSCGFPMSDYIGVWSGRRIQVIIRVINTSGLIQIGTSLILAGVQGYMIPAGKYPFRTEIRGSGV
jgi:hypothetical protein